MMELNSILVISVARIGDTVLLTPTLKAIKARYPRAELTVLAHAKRMEVLENLSCIDHLGPVSKKSVWWRGWLPGKPYDAALVFGRDAALVRYALRVARKVVCFDEPDFKAIRSDALTKVAPPKGPIHAVHHRLLLAEAIDVRQAKDLRLSFASRPDELAAADALLKQRGIAGRRPLIGLQLFSFPAKAHRDWPLAHFIEFIDGVLKNFPDACFVVLGDRLAADQAGPLAARYPQSVQVVAGQLGLRQSVALMSRLDLYLGVDTGPTHLAGALGIAMVALYHWKYPGANLSPLQNPACQIIEHPKTEHPEVDFPTGMEAIPAARVLDAAWPLLNMHLAKGERTCV